MRIKIRVLALYSEIPMFAAVLPRVVFKEKPGQVLFAWSGLDVCGTFLGLVCLI